MSNDMEAALDRVVGLLIRHEIDCDFVGPALVRISCERCWINLAAIEGAPVRQRPTIGVFSTTVMTHVESGGPRQRILVDEVLRELNNSVLLVRFQENEELSEIEARRELGIDDVRPSELLHAIRQLSLVHYIDDEYVERIGARRSALWNATR